MSFDTNQLPQTAGGKDQSAITIPHLGDKRSVADMAQMSVRWVDTQLAKGMPHLKLGKRRIRFDMDEVKGWLVKEYSA
jgi:hypothetical protein